MRRLPIKPLSAIIVILLAAALIALAPATAPAADVYNWSWQNPLPQGNDLSAVSAADASHAWAVGRGGTILFNNGSTWSQLMSPASNDLNDVLAIDATHVWAVGSSGTVLFFDGNNWGAQASGTANTLNGLAGFDATHVWAVGSGGTILFYNGSTWSTQVSGTANALLSVTALDASHAWAVGFNGTILSFNGTSWGSQSSGVSDGWITGVSAADSNHVWAEGYRQSGHALAYFILFFNGSSWVTQKEGTDFWLTDISATDANHAWAVGSEGTILYFNGGTWNAQLSPTTEILYGVYAHSADLVFAVGNAGTLLFFNGSWGQQSQGVTFDLNAISAPNQNHAWAVGASGSILYYDGTAWVPQDSGVAGPFFGVFALDETHVWAVGQNGLVVFWDGMGWHSQDSGTTESLYAVTAANATHAWAVGPNGMVRFFDGATWSGQTSGTTQWLTGVSAADATHVWAVGNGKTLLYFNGTAWQNVETSAPGGLNSVCALDPSHVWAVGSGGYTIFIDGGLSWHTQDAGTTLDLSAVSAVSADRVWAVGAGGVVRRFDGHSWMAQSGASLHDLAGISAPDGGHAWVAGDNGNILVAAIQPQNTSRTWGTESIGTPVPALDWYLAEGSTGPGFETWVLVQNPGAVAANVSIDFLTASGEVAGPTINVPPRSRITVNAADSVPGEWSVSTAVHSTRPVVAERAVYGANRTWGTDSIGAVAQGTDWYLAEGSTGEGFETWILVENPNGAAAHITLSYMTATGAVTNRAAVVPARSRATFNVADTVPGVWSVSTKVHSSDQPIVAERAMYGTGRVWGTDSIGTTTPVTDWYLAEGSTGPGFETWILVQNPNPAPTSIAINYMTPGGSVAATADTLPAHSRKSYNVSDVVPSTWQVSTHVHGDNPVVVERAMYGNGRTWGTDSIGAQAAAADWYLAEGSTGPGFETWVLVQNPTPGDAEVVLHFMTPFGEVQGPAAILPGQSRMTFNVAATVPGDFSVSTRVESSKPVIAERAIYGDAK
jgi:Family of unknown function (DUF5719)